MNGVLRLGGTFELVYFVNGEKKSIVVPNTITNYGLGYFCDAIGVLGTERPAPARYLAVGTGVPVGGKLATSLYNEITRVLSNYRREGSVFVLENTFNVPGFISECGVFHVSSGGNLICFASFNPVPGNNLTIRYRIEFLG